MIERDSHGDEILGKAYDARLMRRLLTYLKPHRAAVAAAIALLAVTAMLELAGPFLTKIAIDRYIAAKDVSGLTAVVLLYFGALTAALGLGYAQIYIMQKVGQEIMVKLRTQIFSHLQELHVGFFDRNPVGRLITRLTSDVDALNEMFTSGVVAIFGDVITLLGIMTVLLVLNWKLALVAFAVLPLLFWLSLWFRNNVRANYRQVRVRLARINSFLQEAVTGMPVLQVMNHEERSRREFDELNRGYTEAHLKSIFYYATFYPLVELISAVALALVIWIGGEQIIRGAFTLGGLVAFLQYVRRFYRPIQDLSEKYNILQAAMAASERIFTLLDTRPEIVDREGARTPEKRGEEVPAIEFRNVWFAYNPGEWVLRDVSFQVRHGESVAFVGATGAGKTSIMSLLMRFYDVQKGSILVEGVDIRDWPQRELRRGMSLVLQDVFLFSGSVAENVRLGNETVTDEQVREAVRTVNAKRFVEALPVGLDTRVGERGASLSTGQKQLLSFARALARDPEVLILDEATSNVDTETEILIQDALERLMSGRTSLVVAHRLSTVRNVDRIIVLHKGRIRESGTHQELLKKRGVYYTLYLLQYQAQAGRAPEGAPASSA